MRRIALEKFTVIAVIAAVTLGTTLLSACSNDALNPTSVSPSQTSALRYYHKRRRDTAGVAVTVDPSQVGAAMNVNDLGSGLAVWYNLALPGIAQAFQSTNLTLTRFPGGKQADIYHWKTATDGPAGTPCAGVANPSSTFDALMQNIANPAHLKVAITVNYGSNATCNGGADPNEAASWLAYVRQAGYSVVYATVGNEQYVPGAVDCRQAGCKSSRDPVQYSANEPAFYNAIKNADPNVSVCIDANLQNMKSPWNRTVFAGAEYDCAEIHYYPQRVITSDTFLLYSAIPQLTTDINAVKSELAAAGHANTPLYLGEIASALGPYGKQSQSIVGALYAGMAIGEVEQDGVAAMTWHIGHGSCNGPGQGGDFSQDVYGLQNYGGAMIFSDRTTNNCPGAPTNTLLATANAFLTGSYFVHAGEKMLATSVAGSPDVRAYGGTYQGGYAVMLFNLNETTAQDVGVTIAGKSSGSGGTVVTYDKSLYDQSANNVWAPPSVTSLGSWTNSMELTLPPWSMVVVQTH